jgi:hypothetical protein
VCAIGGHRRQTDQLCRQSPVAQDGHHALDKAHLADKVCGIMQRTVVIQIT